MDQRPKDKEGASQKAALTAQFQSVRTDFEYIMELNIRIVKLEKRMISLEEVIKRDSLDKSIHTLKPSKVTMEF